MDTYTRTWRNISEIKAANKELGHFWFSPDTIRFFNTKVVSKVINGRYFITSEYMGDDFAQKRFTARIAADDGSIDTVGEFNVHATVSDALAAIHSHQKVSA